MFFFGKSKLVKHKGTFGIKFEKVNRFVVFNRYTGRRKNKIPHHYLTIWLGFYCFFIGYNRFKRIIKNKVYELDGIKYGHKKQA